MVFITAEVFAENCIYTIKQQKKDKTTVLWIRIKDLAEKLDIKIFLIQMAKKLRANLKIIQQKNKLKNIKDMVQSLLKMSNIFMHTKVL